MVSVLTERIFYAGGKKMLELIAVMKKHIIDEKYTLLGVYESPGMAAGGINRFLDDCAKRGDNPTNYRFEHISCNLNENIDQ